MIESGRDDIELVGINDPGGNFFPLLKYDSIHGRAPFEVEKKCEDFIYIDGKKIKRFRNRDPKNIAWSDVETDIVFECTGKFTDREGAGKRVEEDFDFCAGER